MPSPRIALLGLSLESNRFSPTATEADFLGRYWFEGDDMLAAGRAPSSPIAQEAGAFMRMMDATGPWEPVPLILASGYPSGPIEGEFFGETIDLMTSGLKAALPLDAVYVCNHGAMVGTDDLDPDGSMLEAIRAAVGPACRIVVNLDLHGNISKRMVENSDLIVGYRTNPHVDQIERGEEAATSLRLMLAGLADPKPVLVKLPLAPASVTLLTAAGPYADLIDLGQRRQAEHSGAILNVSVFGNFVFSDTPDNGIGVVVTGRREPAPAEALAMEIAERAWADRTRFKKPLTSLGEAVRLATTTDRNPLIFSDAGDNPGGGGSGRTTELLRALVEAGAPRALYGSFFDMPLAEEAHALGLGTTFRARFNRHPGTQFDVPFEADAEIVGLHDGQVTGRLGLFQGRELSLGPSAALRIGDMTVIVISERSQTADPVFFEMFGLDIGAAHTVVVKSRGHFRAGFAPWFGHEQVIEVDTAGLTSPVLERFDWRGLPRPIYPLDEDAEWRQFPG
ncbi:MAG: M81 family metallopeptidase [Alphaproteobacteria bacterium]|nr:M81 family metallopeptidase [Alphaproteobacteria bacterium]